MALNPHTSCNAVPLVWGSLRLAPIIAYSSLIDERSHCEVMPPIRHVWEMLKSELPSL